MSGSCHSDSVLHERQARSMLKWEEQMTGWVIVSRLNHSESSSLCWCMFEELSAFWHFYSPPDYFCSITALLDADWLSSNGISSEWQWLLNAHPSCSEVKLKWCLWVASCRITYFLQRWKFDRKYPHLCWSLEDKARQDIFRPVCIY